VLLPVRLPILLDQSQFYFAPSHQNLKQLVAIRLVVLIGQSLAAFYSAVVLKLQIDYVLVTGLLLLSFAISTATLWRTKKSWPITDVEFQTHLLLDILSLSALLYITGGANNPFISYFLVPITVSAALLPWLYTWGTAIVSLICYTLLVFYYVPLPEISPHHLHDQHNLHNLQADSHQPSINLHVVGMWLNFVVSAWLITYFVVKMAQVLREQQQSLNQVREDTLRDEQIVAVATLAAGTAHELGTPLSTMAVLVKEMENDYNDNPQLQEDIMLLKSQLAKCKDSLQALVKNAERQSVSELQTIVITDLMGQLVEQWQLLRPEVALSFSIAESCVTEPPKIDIDTLTKQAIINILNNAADASPEHVEMTLSWTLENWVLLIRDFGPGVPVQVAEQIGRAFITTKSNALGLGIGLMLTHASIAKLGGTVKLYNHPESGACTELKLPLYIDSIN